MKNILIIGDSWGVPNYPSEHNTPYQAHTEYQLRNLGYNVFNYSLNGGSMIETIEYARLAITNSMNTTSKNQQFTNAIYQKRSTYNVKKLSSIDIIPLPNYNNEKIDWILWFHTESIRESLSPQQYTWTTLKELHEFNINCVYRSFADLVKLCPKVKTAIIGGQAPVDKLLYNYHQPNFIIEDWRSQLVGEKLPWCHTLSRLDVVESLGDSVEAKLEIMKSHEKIINSMSNKELFFDNCHPGSKPHRELSLKLHQVFQTT